jgi:hypothetical protein
MSREHEKGGDQVLTERYQPSRKQGERHSAPVYVRRGEEYLAAVALLDQATKHRQHATCVRGDHAATCREDITHCPCLGGVQRFPIPSHPDALMFPALAAHAPLHICSVRAVLQVITTGYRQRRFELLGPFLIGLGEPHT